jgi:hypothetical protein
MEGFRRVHMARTNAAKDRVQAVEISRGEGNHFAIARRNASHEQGQNRWLHRGDLLCPFLCPAPASAGAESGDVVRQDLTGKAANYKDFRVGEVAEWLKAAVC